MTRPITIRTALSRVSTDALLRRLDEEENYLHEKSQEQEIHFTALFVHQGIYNMIANELTRRSLDEQKGAANGVVHKS